jgi:8-oxo-dGTP diphosphatase
VAILVVRHAKAGDRQAWTQPDHLRPLTAKGLAQADALVETLAGFAIARVLTSPYARCVETVAPLAATRGLPAEACDDLAEGAGTAALALVGTLAAGPATSADVVLCTHGDVLFELLDGLGLRTDVPMKKGSTWVLRVAGGRVVDASYLPPPA